MSRPDPDSSSTTEVQEAPVPSEVHSKEVTAGPVDPKEGSHRERKQPERVQTEANLTWPPTKEDLERLYVKERLSAMKIAKLYGLKYPNPKSSEVMILYHLKHKGIARRDPAEHNRKATKEVVDAWVKRYEGGESLKQIAGDEFSPVTVFHHLRKRGMKLRDKVEEVIRLNTVHKKTPFSGDPLERAYLLGFARGDLWVTTHGRAVRARGGSTHPAFIRLFRNLFEHYGPVYIYPKEAKLTGYEWSMDADLDDSFRFLLDRDPNTFQGILTREQTFFSYLAGIFDAEGSVHYHRKGGGGAFESSVTNMDIELLRVLLRQLEALGYHAKLESTPHSKDKTKVRGADYIWRIQVWRYKEVKGILNRLPLRHSEKVAKREIALTLPTWPSPDVRRQVLSRWEELLDRIEYDVQESIKEAKNALAKKSVASLS